MFPSTFLLSLGFVIYPYTAGQGVTTTAECTTDTWTNNEEGQSPCLVTSALQAACDGGNFNVPALLPGEIYFGPQLGFGNPCTCSTVTYSMAMACGACQGAGINKWSTWMTNCTPNEVSIRFFPLAIPPSVTIPAWAYENVTAHDLWDANEALTIANEHVPDSSALPQPTDPGSRSTESSNSKSSSTNIAAIAGGAAGGVVLIILVVLAIFFWRRRRNKKGSGKKSSLIQPWIPNEQEKFLQPSNNNNDGLPQQQKTRAPSPPSADPFQDITMTQPAAPQPPQQFIPYDPADPSTFPTTPMITLGAPVPPNDQITRQQQLLQAPNHSQRPSSSSIRSLPTSPMSLSHNSFNPNNAVAAPYASSSRSGPTDTAMIPMHPTSYGAPSTRNEHTFFNQGPMPIQSQHDSSLYVISNVSYNQNHRLQMPYGGSSQQRSGGYTGAAEI